MSDTLVDQVSEAAARASSTGQLTPVQANAIREIVKPVAAAVDEMHRNIDELSGGLDEIAGKPRDKVSGAGLNQPSRVIGG